jgi:molecular chaperone GrpE
VLTDFRAWLQRVAAQPPAGGGPPAARVEEEPIDLHTLLAQFVAVRHEVNLQTKAARAQQEQNAVSLEQLEQALAAFQEAQGRAREADEKAQDELLRPLLKTLVDSYDALALAVREVQRVQEAALPLLSQLAAAPEPAPPPPWSRPEPPHGFWDRWFGGRSEPAQVRAAEAQPTAQQERQAEQAAGQVRRLLDSVITGYTMSLRRMERALQQYGLEPTPCVGQAFDPERMEVVEVVHEPGRSATEVIEEVRRGYLWRGRLFRYAQVRVARP